ncbi:MAG: DUF2252 domain-containing protein [Microthrixaceae bacterium]|nr:DUF2252 domain-containing protein [Microthrixaceae bacterium]
MVLRAVGRRAPRAAGRARWCKAGQEVDRRATKALQRDHLHAFDRYLTTVDGRPRFVSDPPLLVPADELLEGESRERYVEVVRDFLTQYRTSLRPDRRALLESYRFVQLARKVVGVGSVGTRAWVVLMKGRDADDPLLLQLKEAQPSVLAPYAGATTYESEGRRVVEGQRLMETAPDHLLGWYRLRAWDGQMRDFYVRQLWDGKASIDVTRLSAKGLRAYGETCGWTLARAHARSGDRVAMAAYLGDDDLFEQAVALLRRPLRGHQRAGPPAACRRCRHRTGARHRWDLTTTSCTEVPSTSRRHRPRLRGAPTRPTAGSGMLRVPDGEGRYGQLRRRAHHRYQPEVVTIRDACPSTPDGEWCLDLRRVLTGESRLAPQGLITPAPSCLVGPDETRGPVP